MTTKSNQPTGLLFEEITLRNQTLRIEHTQVPIGAVLFDPENPRLKYQKALHPDKTDAELIFANKDTALLKADIKEKGLIDAIYVKVTNGHYIVVEGNRRSACFKELNAELPDDLRFATIKARILPAHTTDEQIALLMASYHISGKIKWDAHEKAGHIYHMHEVLHIPELEMINTLHMSGGTIRRIAESYRVLEKVYRSIDNGAYADGADGKWSFFSEMLKIKELKERHEQDPAWAETFSRWVGEGRIPHAEDVRQLGDILNKAQARTLFENSPAEEAFQKARHVSDRANPSRKSKFYARLDDVIRECNRAPFSDVEEASSNEAARVKLQDAYNTIGNFMERAGVRFPTPSRSMK
jgi:hypothetical protein